MYIFLDIDGVMVHAIPHKKVEFESDGFYKFIPEAVERLNSILNEGDEIILSTSHRFLYNLTDWERVFSSRGIKKVKISRIHLPVEELSRKEEILFWMSEKELKCEEIIIIDDDKSLNDLPSEYKEKLILTNPYIGLTKI